MSVSVGVRCRAVMSAGVTGHVGGIGVVVCAKLILLATLANFPVVIGIACDPIAVAVGRCFTRESIKRGFGLVFIEILVTNTTMIVCRYCPFATGISSRWR